MRARDISLHHEVHPAKVARETAMIVKCQIRKLLVLLSQTGGVVSETKNTHLLRRGRKTQFRGPPRYYRDRGDHSFVGAVQILTN